MRNAGERSPGPSKQNQSVAKVLQIIEVMADADGPMRLHDIARKVNVPDSTVLRFLKSLMEREYVQQNPDTLQYFLTLRLCRLADRVKQQTRIRDIVHPHLVHFSKEVGESVSLALESDHLVVYVDFVEGQDSILQTLQRIGKIAPMHSTGVGKALLSGKSEAEIDAVVTSRGLLPITPRTIATKEDLIRDLKEIRARGYATDDEECEEGVRCVAAPIRDYTGSVIAAISATGPANRMTVERLPEVGGAIDALAQKISFQLGYDEPAVNE